MFYFFLFYSQSSKVQSKLYYCIVYSVHCCFPDVYDRGLNELLQFWSGERKKAQVTIRWKCYLYTQKLCMPLYLLYLLANMYIYNSQIHMENSIYVFIYVYILFSSWIVNVYTYMCVCICIYIEREREKERVFLFNCESRWPRFTL